MPSLIDFLQDGRRIGQSGPWPRVVLDAKQWEFAARELARGSWSLLGLWGEPSTVHMAILDEAAADIAIVSLDCPDRHFPSVGALHPPALRLERTAHDLFGLVAQGLPDTRPWLDHSNWGVRFPLGDRIDALRKSPPYRFLPVEGERHAPDRGRPGRMPASSSPDISASPRAARPWCGSNSGSDMSTRASRG